MNSNNDQDGRTYQRLDIHPSVIRKLGELQRSLKVPKLRKMRMGSNEVPYRNAEDILSAVTKQMGEGWAIVSQYTDYHEEGTGIPMLSCNVRFICEEGYCSGVTFAVPVEGGGAQNKGKARSYALKYALCDLFGIDDGLDNDASTDTNAGKPLSAPAAPRVPLEQAIADLEAAIDGDDLDERGKKYGYYYGNEKFRTAGKAKRDSFKQPAKPTTTDGKDNAQ